jgi:hypothetical protein
VKKRHQDTGWTQVQIGEKDTTAINTSYHHLIATRLEITGQSETWSGTRKVKPPRRRVFQRNETSIEQYRATLDQELQSFDPNMMDPDYAIEALQSIINIAMIESTPSRLTTGRAPPANRKANWTPELEAAVKASKEAHHTWKALGRPRGDDPSWMNKKIASKEIRSVQRRQPAKERLSLMREIDVAAENDSRLIHKLLRKKRN